MEAHSPPPSQVHLGSDANAVVGLQFTRKFADAGHQGVVSREVTASVGGSATDRVFDVKYGADNDDEQLSLSTLLLLSDREWLNKEAIQTTACGKKRNKAASILYSMLHYE